MFKRLALCLPVIGSPVFAQNVTGNDIFNACNSQPPGNEVELGFCVGYVTGAWEGLKIGAGIMVMQAQPGGDTQEVEDTSNMMLGVCFPPTGEARQIIDVYTSSLAQNPQTRHEPARMLLFLAMREAFPCG